MRNPNQGEAEEGAFAHGSAFDPVITVDLLGRCYTLLPTLLQALDNIPVALPFFQR